MWRGMVPKPEQASKQECRETMKADMRQLGALAKAVESVNAESESEYLMWKREGRSGDQECPNGSVLHMTSAGMGDRS